MSNRLEQRPATKTSATTLALCRGAFPVTAGVHGHAQAVVVLVERGKTRTPSTEPTAKE